MADVTLPNTKDIYVRIGLVRHFDLRIRADSLAGVAISEAFGVERLSDDAGEARIRAGLELEQHAILAEEQWAEG